MLAEHLQQLEMLVGPRVQSLLRNKEATQKHLADPDPRMRWAAVTLMTHHWGPTEQFKNKCEEMAFHDADPLVRSRAIGCLGALFSGTDNRRIGKLLAGVICNNAEHYSSRASAYSSLLRLSGAPGYRIFGPSPVDLRIPEDIDWELVEFYRKTTEI